MVGKSAMLWAVGLVALVFACSTPAKYVPLGSDSGTSNIGIGRDGGPIDVAQGTRTATDAAMADTASSSDLAQGTLRQRRRRPVPAFRGPLATLRISVTSARPPARRTAACSARTRGIHRPMEQLAAWDPSVAMAPVRCARMG